MKLLPRRPGGFGGQGNGHDWMFRPKRFEMGLEQAEQNSDGVGRVGDVKAMRVMRLVGKGEPEGYLPGDKVECAEAQPQLFKEAAEDKKKRFRCLNLIIEFDLFSENFCWPNESQKPGRPTGGLLPEKDRAWAKARAELIGRESRQVAQGVNAPFVQNRNEVGEFFVAVKGAQGCLFGGLTAQHERKLEPERNMFNRTYFS